MQILGIANFYPSAPVDAPTSLSNVPSITSVAISFTAPTNNGGAAITNYEYSFNGSSWTALSPADAVSPITVSGLTANTTYTVYLRAVNIVGSGPASSGTSFTTNKAAPTSVEALVLSGGAGGGQATGGGGNGGGGGGGGYTAASASVTTGVAYTITVGAGVARATNGIASSAALGSTVSSSGGSLGANANGNVGGAGGAGGAGSTTNGATGGTGGTGGGNGGAGGNGGTGTGGGAGGTGGSSGAGGNGTANTGGGGGGGGYSAGLGGSGGSGKVTIRYSDSFALAVSTTGSPTIQTTGGFHIYTFTGSGSITF
jgi:hypothetical protein